MSYIVHFYGVISDYCLVRSDQNASPYRYLIRRICNKFVRFCTIKIPESLVMTVEAAFSYLFWTFRRIV